MSSNNTNTNSETDVPVGEGLGYPPQVVVEPEFATNISHTEDELSNVEENRLNFIGEYCEKCVGTHNRCWCNSSDLDEESVDLENPTNNADPNLESKRPSPTSFRQPPPGWSEFRRRAISKSKATLENSDNLTIKNCKSVSTEEFNNM